MGAGCWAWLLVGVLALGWGCRAPVGMERQGLLRVHRRHAGEFLAGRLGEEGRGVLERRGLRDAYEADPEGTLRRLHALVVADGGTDECHALAELCFAHAVRLSRSPRAGDARRAPGWHLASAAYAWFFVMGDGAAPEASPIDGRVRDACDIYNAAVGLSFRVRAGTNVVVDVVEGPRIAGVGIVRVAGQPLASQWTGEAFGMFLPAAEFEVRGLRVRDRVSGMGTPLIGVGMPEAEVGRLARRAPATLFLRFGGRLREWERDGLVATAELYSSHEVAEVEVAGRRIPLEADFTAPMAHGLMDPGMWTMGLVQLLTGKERVRSNIYLTEPYRRGKIPVVFVHGTASSPAFWAEMWNTLRSDRRIRERFQFWNFVYNSGNPVGHSAEAFRRQIERKLGQLDPSGHDPALRQMVLVGHSQGGLLAGLMVKDTGDSLWRAVSARDFGELAVPALELEEVRRRYFFTALPAVRRVVFISTPHRGSRLATSWVRSVGIRVIRLPAEVMHASARLLALKEPLGLRPGHERRVPSSLDDMSPDNPWILALAGIPPAPGVSAHSIVAVRGRGSPPAGGDGVVAYGSAHLDYARSEFVVRSGHSCQRRSEVIEEVRRILLEHDKEAAGDAKTP